MKSEEQVRRAVAVIGVAVADPYLRKRLFGALDNEHVTRAWFAFSTLGWVVGADESLFAGLLEYCELKLAELGVAFREDGVYIPREDGNGR